MGLNIGFLTALLGGSPIVAGTAAANQPLVLGASKEVATITTATITNLTSTTITATSVIGNHRVTVNNDLAGAGTVQADAAQLLEGFTVITGANGTLGWKLPVAVAGMQVMIKGTTAGVAKIWPNTGGTINALSQDAAMSLASGVIPAIFVAKSATQWYTFPLLPS